MDTNGIIKQIDTEISNLQQARAILVGIETKKGPGRPKSVESQVTKPEKRRMSAKGRAAISAAMKARWAKARATKTVAKKAATKS
jgi:low affinity Fe/Cu permease